MRIFTKKFIGVDLYDQPVRAVEKDAGLFVDKSIEQIVYDMSKTAESAQELLGQIKNQYYWGNFEFTVMLLKFIIKNQALRLNHPKLLLSVPSDIVRGRFGSLIVRFLSEAGLSSGCSQVQLIENAMCAAIGSGFMTGGASKFGFVYVNEWCTYIMIIVAGGILQSALIEKGYHEITAVEILSKYEVLVENHALALPESYYKMKQSNAEFGALSEMIKKPMENKIRLAVPDEMKGKLGNRINQYELQYGNQYSSCIIKGLEAAVMSMEEYKTSTLKLV